MEFKFNIEKDERKALVKAVSEITGWEPVYKGAPSFSYAVDNYTIDRNGALICDERTSIEDVRRLLSELTERGFVFEGNIDEIAPIALEQARSDGPVECETGTEAEAENEIHTVQPVATEMYEELPLSSSECDQDGSDTGESDLYSSNECDATDNEDSCKLSVKYRSGKISITVPLSGFTNSSLVNLNKLISTKAWIIQKMAEVDTLPIEQAGEYLRFTWFKWDATPAEIAAYSCLITRLCETAKTKQRVVAEERPLQPDDNEKFKARCFLLALGFIGPEYAQARKILLAPMSGNGSHKSGNGKKIVSESDQVTGGDRSDTTASEDTGSAGGAGADTYNSDQIEE